MDSRYNKLVGSVLCILLVAFMAAFTATNMIHPKEIPVLINYSDTATTMLFGVDDNGWETSESGKDVYTYWMEGWKVGDKFTDAAGNDLPKTTVIWSYKEIKQ